MKLLSPGRHGRLLFRTYVVLVGGLVASAAIFDYGFARLQDTLGAGPNVWVDANLTLIESRIAAAPRGEWPAVVEQLEGELGFPVRILPLDDVVRPGRAAGGTQEIFDAAERSSYLRTSAALDAAIQIGPVAAEESAQTRLLNVIPPLFYLAIFVLVGLWLWPLIRDVDLLTGAARDFAADYRQPLSTRSKVTTLQDLATNLDEMSDRIRGLIQGQKDLTSALSHEIRTPLARIKFAMAVIGPKAPFADELHAINEDVREIDRLISTMLEFARLDHPDTEMNWQLTPIDEWLEPAASKCLLREGQRIEYRASPGLVRMDPDLMDLLLSNLLVNACRYADRRVSIAFTTGEDAYVLTVEDDGPGIPEAERETVFKAFARLDNSRNRETGGYGLGLATVARVAALHGGFARAERSSLGGARIVVTWPRDARAAAATARSGS